MSVPRQDSEVFITVSDCRVVVCRYHQLPNGSIMMQCARNTEDLEPDAIVAVVAYGNSLFSGHLHACPPDLAARARWS
jgi:hypothetical protein